MLPIKYRSELTPRKPTYLIPSFIEEGQPNLLFGSGGVGKSYLAAHVAMSLASGSDFIGETPTRKCRSLYLDFEGSEDIFAYRLLTLEPSLSTWNKEADQNITYFSATKPLVAIAKELKEAIDHHKIDLLIIDSAAYACGGEVLDPDSAIQYFATLNSLGVTSLTLAHETKAKAHDNAFGSIFFMNSVRNAWNVTREREVGLDTVKLTLAHRKGNNTSLSDNITAFMEFGEDTVNISRSAEQVRQEKTMKESIIGLLASNDLTAKELSVLLGNSEGSLRKVLGRLRKEGSVAKVSQKWHLRSA
jgi:hypothetical protein